MADDDKPDDKPDDDAKPDDKPGAAKPDPGADELALTRAALKKANKEAEAARLKLKEHEDAGKSELERATSRVAELERSASEAESRAMRLEVASDKGLTAAQAKRLVGTTREELEADADELLETFGDSTVKPGGKPRPDLRGGGDPSDEPDETDPRKLADRVSRR